MGALLNGQFWSLHSLFHAARPLQLTPLAEQQYYPFPIHAVSLTSRDTSNWKMSWEGKANFGLVTALSTFADNVKICKWGSAGQAHRPSALAGAFTCSRVCCLHFGCEPRKPSFPVICLPHANDLDTSYQTALRESLWFTIARDSFCSIGSSYGIKSTILNPYITDLEEEKWKVSLFVCVQIISLHFLKQSGLAVKQFYLEFLTLKVTRRKH